MLHPSLRHTSPRAFSQTIRRLRQRQASSLIRLRYALASSSTATSHSMMLMDHINAISLGIHFLLGKKSYKSPAQPVISNADINPLSFSSPLFILTDQHVSWNKQTGNHAQVLCPVEVAHQAVNDARRVCADTFGESTVPVVNIKKSQPSSHHALEVTHVPNVLHRMLYESTLIALRSHYTQPSTPTSSGWLQRLFGRRQPTWTPLQLDVFGGPTSIGYRLTNPAPLQHGDLQHDIPRDPMGVPSCASILRTATHGYNPSSSSRHSTALLEEEQEDHDNAEWSVWSGWRMAKTMASHFGGNLDVVSAEGLGSTMYLALDRDHQLLERYPSVLPNRLSSHQRYASSHLSLQHATSQLDAFLYAVADPNNSIYTTTTYTSPATHHHAVSLTAAVGHA